MNATTTETASALAALRSLRDATERALAALERDDPDTAQLAVADGSLASADVSALLQKDFSASPEIRREYEHLRVLQAVAVDTTERRMESIARELKALAQTQQGLRGYRPEPSDDSSYQFDS